MIKRIIDKIYLEMHIFKFKSLYKNKITIGRKISFRKRLNIRISKGGSLNIGEKVFFNNDCSINCAGKIEIGDFCIFGENVKLYDHGHNYSNPQELIRDQGLKKGKITMGKNCWIGSNVTILANVEIGENVIIGANCLIYKSIPSNSIVKCNSGLIIEKLIYKDN